MGMDIDADFSKMDRIIAQFPNEADAWLRGVTQQILNEIVLSFNTSPPGAAYHRGSITHIASQAGYPPNVDTGALRASMKWQKVGNLNYEISDGTEYGIYLEYGTSKMDARPFISPVFEAWRRLIVADFMQNVGVLK